MEPREEDRMSTNPLFGAAMTKTNTHMIKKTASSVVIVLAIASYLHINMCVNVCLHTCAALTKGLRTYPEAM